jgi:large subunit ribosomal protein L23
LPTDRNLASVIIKPRITEKSVQQGEKNVYTFIVRRDASKHDVKDAIKAIYNVTPVKVNIVNKTPRQFMSRSRGRSISEKGMKKAYVYLKAGDRIDLV